MFFRLSTKKGVRTKISPEMRIKKGSEMTFRRCKERFPIRPEVTRGLTI